MTEEFTVIVWLFVLLFAYIGIRPVLRLTENGVMKALGPQDDYPEVLNTIGLRAERANHNFKETLPIALALLIAVPVAGKADSATATAAWIYFYARAAYLPAYIIGIPGLRTLIWAVATAAIGYLAWVLIA